MKHTVLSLWKGRIDAKPSMEQMLSAVAEEHGVSVRELKSVNQSRRISDVRRVFMAEAYDTGRFSMTQIGRFLGRDHTTVSTGIAAVRGQAVAA